MQKTTGFARRSTRYALGVNAPTTIAGSITEFATCKLRESPHQTASRTGQHVALENRMPGPLLRRRVE